MRYLLLLFLASVFCIAARAGEPAGSEAKPVRDPYEVVRTTKLFIIGGVGVAGSTSGEEAAFRQLLKQPESLARCQKLLVDGTPEGQLYGLLGLHILDPEAFKAALPRYRESKVKIQSISGCMHLSATTAQIAREIEAGQLH